MVDLDNDLKEYRRDQAFRNRVIEECARVAEGSVLGFRYPDVCEAIAAAIRALKDKP